jgi:hypothetical protein
MLQPMKTVNFCLWSLGLLLQAVLLIRITRFRLFLHMPMFAILIAFYVVRSLILYCIFTHLDVVAYNHLKDVLSLVDLVLQIVLALEIALHTLRALPPTHPGRRLHFAAPLTAGAILAVILALAVPETARVPFDRGIVFTALLALLLFAWMTLAKVTGSQRLIAGGLAFYGIIAVLAAIGRNYSILYRSPAGFLTASYTQSGAYLLIALYWILTIRAA